MTFGRAASVAFYFDVRMLEPSPNQEPLYLNIAYTLDIYTWLLLGSAMLSVGLVLSVTSSNHNEKVFGVETT